VYLDRTLIVCTPAYALLPGWALATKRLRSPVPYLMDGILAMMFWSFNGYYFDERFGKPDYRAAAALAGQVRDPDHPLVHTGSGGYVPFLYHLGPDQHFILEADPAPHYPARIHETADGRLFNRDDLVQ
jgi:hypothetical protein